MRMEKFLVPLNRCYEKNGEVRPFSDTLLLLTSSSAIANPLVRLSTFEITSRNKEIFRAGSNSMITATIIIMVSNFSRF